MNDKEVDWSASVATELKERIESLEKKVSEMKEWENYLSKGGLLEQIMEQIAEIMKKLTWLSDENAKLYTQVDDDALKRAKLEEVLQKTLKKLADVGISGYIEEKSIFLGQLYYPCNIIDCPVKQAVLSYEGNSYCMKHFIEFIQDDTEERVRGATRKELIEEFLKGLRELCFKLDFESELDKDFFHNFIEKWQGRIK